jgi:hypothetical protein
VKVPQFLLLHPEYDGTACTSDIVFTTLENAEFVIAINLLWHASDSNYVQVLFLFSACTYSIQRD